MGDKNEVTYIEEQSVPEKGTTDVKLLNANGTVLIPQPTADPNGDFPSV